MRNPPPVIRPNAVYTTDARGGFLVARNTSGASGHATPLPVVKVRAPGSGTTIRQSPGYVPAVVVPRSPMPIQNNRARPLSRAARARVTTGNFGNGNPIAVDYFT